MTRRFQFSLRRMFVATALFALAAWSIAECQRQISRSLGDRASGVAAYLLFIGAIMSGIAGFGAITEKQVSKIAKPLAVFALVAFFLMILIFRS
jgi:hypothetical protein